MLSFFRSSSCVNSLLFVVNGTRRSYSSSSSCFIGFDEFIETKAKPDETVVTGRGWTVPDLRRKSFDDLHKLWYVLYKERNLILSEKEKTRRSQRPILSPQENRYIKVKRSMAGIKVVLNERKRIQVLIDKESNSPPNNNTSKH